MLTEAELEYIYEPVQEETTSQTHQDPQGFPKTPRKRCCLSFFSTLPLSTHLKVRRVQSAAFLQHFLAKPNAACKNLSRINRLLYDLSPIFFLNTLKSLTWWALKKECCFTFVSFKGNSRFLIHDRGLWGVFFAVFPRKAEINVTDREKKILIMELRESHES